MTKEEIIQILRDCLVVETIGQGEYSFKIAFDNAAEAILNRLNRQAEEAPNNIRKVEICIKCDRILHYDSGSGQMMPDFTKEHGHLCIVDGERCEKS